MNPIDDQLNRLFRSAGQIRGDVVSAMPFGLETRVLAAWRESRALPFGVWDLSLLLRGFVIACVLMAVSFWPALSSSSSSTNPVSDFLQLTDSTVSSDTTP